jgi:hypothetical protein
MMNLTVKTPFQMITGKSLVKNSKIQKRYDIEDEESSKKTEIKPEVVISSSAPKILIMGSRRSGKTSIQQVVWSQSKLKFLI